MEGEVAWEINFDETFFPDKILWDKGSLRFSREGIL